MLTGLIRKLYERPQRVAATFTPCQLAGWRRLRNAFPEITGKRRSLAVGLFCGYVQTHDAIKGSPRHLTLSIRTEPLYPLAIRALPGQHPL